MTTTLHSNVSISRQLYHSIRPHDADGNTLTAWMQHIVAYLTTPAAAVAAAARERSTRHGVQGPQLLPNSECDGSCDSPANRWVNETPYEEHYRKLLMSRVNAGDANRAVNVDEESLRREAYLVMESNRQPAAVGAEQQTDAAAAAAASSTVDTYLTGAANTDEVTLLDLVSAVSLSSGESDDWDFVLYGSDPESEYSDDSDTFSEYSFRDTYLYQQQDDCGRRLDRMEEDSPDVRYTTTTVIVPLQAEANAKGTKRRCGSSAADTDEAGYEFGRRKSK